MQLPQGGVSLTNSPEHKDQYGATAQGIAFNTGCSLEEAQHFIDTERALFPDVEIWYDDVITPAVRRSAQAHNEIGEDGHWRQYCTGTYVANSGTTYEFREWPKTVWAEGRPITSMEFKPTQIRNYPIQGESAFFVQVTSGMFMRWMVSKNFFERRAYIINTVHDANYLDVHLSVLDEVCGSLKATMESLPEVMKNYGYDLGLPFPVEVKYGPNMVKKQKWTKEKHQ